MSSLSSVLATAVLLIVLAMCSCQLTFSPNWGKRSTPHEMLETRPGICGTPNDMLVDMFKFMQNEFQVYLDCNQMK